MRREYRHSHRADLGGFATTGEVQHQVEVVDHEVEHHRDIGAAERERRHPLGLGEARPVEQRQCGAHRPVEPLDVPDGERDAFGLRQGDEVVGLLQRGGERLLH